MYTSGMGVHIPDEVLKQAGLSEREALVEIACRLVQAEKLTLPQGAKLAGLTRVEFETELLDRGIPLYRPTLDEILADADAVKRLKE